MISMEIALLQQQEQEQQRRSPSLSSVLTPDGKDMLMSNIIGLLLLLLLRAGV